MKIGYVCTNYNNAHFTHEAVRSLLAATGGEARIVVVDNRSEPGERSKLEAGLAGVQNVDVLWSEENLGYFRGLNAGIARLRDNQPGLDCVVAGNNDLVFPPDFLERVRAKQELFAVYPVVSPDVVTLDGEHQNPHVISGISWQREIVYDLYHANYWLAGLIRRTAALTHRLTDRKDETHWPEPRTIYQGHGSCYLLGPVFFRHFTAFSAPTFLLGEEYFLSQQLSDAGLSLFYEPSIRVLHHCHAAIGKVPGRKMWEYSRIAHRIYRQRVRVFARRPPATAALKS